MDAIVTAGGIPQPGEPLYEYTQGKSKALLAIAGKPMIQWVLDALSGAKHIDRVVIIGLPPESGLACTKSLAYMPNQGDMVENIRSGVKKVLELNPQAQHVVVVSSDVPGAKPEMVDWVVETALQTDDDFHYNVIRREVMEKRYPGSRRSYLKMKDGEYCGGDINVIRAMTVTADDALWKRIIAARKSAFKQASLVGFDLLLMVLFRRLTVAAAAQEGSRRMRVKARAVICPYAEIGMDVDKPHQFELMQHDLEQQKV
jgi:GTP:adenosylcobinamide-phosphate guanylyltransferase